MDNYSAEGIVKGFIEADETKVIEAWQHLVDTGFLWQLIAAQSIEPWAIQNLIDAGRITLRNNFTNQQEKSK